MSVYRLRTIALVVAVVCSALMSEMPGRAAEKNIDMGAIGGPNIALWPMFIANDKGMFASEGLKINLIYVSTNAGVQQQLAAGSFPIAHGGTSDQVRAIFQGASFAIVRLEAQLSPYALVSKSTIKSIADLRGKTIIVGGAKDITLTYLERMLAAFGIKRGEYSLVFAGSTASRLSALQSGAIDAAILSAPFSFHAESAGFANLGHASDYAKDIPFSAIAVNRAWAAQNKDDLDKFLSVYTKAVAWFGDLKNRAEAIQILRNKINMSQEDLNRSYDFLHKIGFFETKGEVSKKSFVALIETLKGDLGDKVIDIDRLFLTGVTRVTE